MSGPAGRKERLVSAATPFSAHFDPNPRDDAPLSSRPVPKHRATRSASDAGPVALGQVATISSVLARGIAEALEVSGFHSSEFLAASGLDRGMHDQDSGISAAAYERAVEAVLDATGEPALGLLLGERIGLGAFGIVGHLVATAHTFRAAALALVHHERLFGAGFHVRLQEEGDRAWFEIDLPSLGSRAHRFHAELVLTALARAAKSYGSRDMGVRRVLFEHPTPPHEHEYIRLFLGAERFGQPFSGLEIDRSLLDRESFHHDPELFALLEAEAQRRENRTVRGLTHAERLKQYLVDHMSERPDMELAARRLGMSSRSLRRRLTEEGTSWNRITDDALGMLARRMLDDPTSSVKETAYALGFSDPTSLYRAFKRWTGKTPKQYKADR